MLAIAAPERAVQFVQARACALLSEPGADFEAEGDIYIAGALAWAMARALRAICITLRAPKLRLTLLFLLAACDAASPPICRQRSTVAL